MMKTTIELSAPTYRQAQALAARRGLTLKQLLIEVLEERLQHCAGDAPFREHAKEPPWMAGFGALSDLADENRRVLELIEEEFETLTQEDLA